MCLEFLHLRAIEDGSTDADHTGPDLGDAHLWGVSAKNSQPEKREAQGERRKSSYHGSESVIGEKCLPVKEKWAFDLTLRDTV